MSGSVPLVVSGGRVRGMRSLRVVGGIAKGDNIMIDAVLSNKSDALELGQQLNEAGYDVRVIDVEMPMSSRRSESARGGGTPTQPPWTEATRGVGDGFPASTRATCSTVQTADRSPKPRPALSLTRHPRSAATASTGR